MYLFQSSSNDPLLVHASTGSIGLGVPTPYDDPRFSPASLHIMHQDAAGIGYDGEIYRKILHLLALLYPVLYLALPDPWGISLLVFLSLTAVFLDWLRSVNVLSHAFFDRFFGFMMRAQERDVLGENVVINGATWVTVTFTLLVLLFETDVAVVSFATFMIGDAAAALIGRSLGRRSWLRQGATVEGSLAFLIVGSIVGWILTSGILPWPLLSLPFHAVFAATAVAAVIEAAPIPLNDNLTGPLGAALTITGIMASWPS